MKREQFVLFIDLVVINSELELELNPGAKVGWSNYTPGAGAGRDGCIRLFSLRFFSIYFVHFLNERSFSKMFSKIVRSIKSFFQLQNNRCFQNFEIFKNCAFSEKIMVF